MSTRTHISPYAVLNGSSMATSLSAATVLHSCSMASYDISWTGSPTGTITIQVSNSYKLGSDGQSVSVAGSWTTLPFTDSTGTTVTSVAVSGIAGTAFVDIRQISAENIRIVYTRASGTGALTAIFTGKVA